LWSELAKPVCLPFLDDHSFPMHCWALTVQKDDAKQYGTKYAPLTPCENNEIGEYCTETFSCKEKRDMGDTLLCLGLLTHTGPNSDIIQRTNWGISSKLLFCKIFFIDLYFRIDMNNSEFFS
jgi:hypothetical protein